MSNIPNQHIPTEPVIGEESTYSKENIQAYAKEAWGTVQDRTGQVVHDGTVYVRENPVPVAIAAFGVGVLVGLALGHREPETFKKRYIDEPLETSHGALLGLLVALSALARRSLSSVSHAAEDVGESLKENIEPLTAAARRTGRKFGL